MSDAKVWGGDGGPGRVVGIGGVFFRSDDPKASAEWYSEHLGMPGNGVPTMAQLFWRDAETGTVTSTTWAPFERGSDYFDLGQTHMINYMVDDLDAIRAKMIAAGVRVDEKVEDYEYGRFGWFWDAEGVKGELWEPAVGFIRDGYAAMNGE